MRELVNVPVFVWSDGVSGDSGCCVFAWLNCVRAFLFATSRTCVIWLTACVCWRDSLREGVDDCCGDEVSEGHDDADVERCLGDGHGPVVRREAALSRELTHRTLVRYQSHQEKRQSRLPSSTHTHIHTHIHTHTLHTHTHHHTHTHTLHTHTHHTQPGSVHTTNTPVLSSTHPHTIHTRMCHLPSVKKLFVKTQC